MSVRGAHGPSPLQHLPDSEKKSMAIDLLAEFGSNVSREDGDELVHSCVLPFGFHAHGDRNPSASLNWRKLVYHCHVCGGGSLSWLIFNCRGDTTYAQARQWADSKANFSDSDSAANFAAYIDSLLNPEPDQPPPPIPHFNPDILKPWMKVHPYMTDPRPDGRGILLENCIKMKVGYDGGNRIVFPLFWKDKLVGWQTRRIQDDGSPKNKVSPDFPRKQTLYNAEVKADKLIVVESQISVVAKTHLEPDYGFIATFGKEVTPQQLRLLAQYDRLILWFDNDNAGWGATRNVAESLIQYMPIYIVNSPWNADPGDGLDDDTVRELIDGAVTYGSWNPPDEVKEWKPMKKFGTGKVIPEQGDDQKTAKKHWTDKDADELEDENESADKAL